MPRTSGKKSSKQASFDEEEQWKRDEPAGIAQLLERSLEDVRSVVTCRVCVRPLYEPFTIECGHTFCYSCLLRWFKRDIRKKTCPDCRADVTRKPAPAYLVRDITQIFSSRAELLPSGESTAEHKKWHQDETSAVEADKKGPGLFPDCFTREERRMPSYIRDLADGVNRCPRCTWEMEDGECASCGFPYDEDDEDVMFEMMGERSSSFLSTEEESNPDEDMEETEDDGDDADVGSLDDFVVNDNNATRPSPRISARHSPHPLDLDAIESAALRDTSQSRSDGGSTVLSLHSDRTNSSSHSSQPQRPHIQSNHRGRTSGRNPPISHVLANAPAAVVWESDSSSEESLPAQRRRARLRARTVLSELHEDETDAIFMQTRTASPESHSQATYDRPVERSRAGRDDIVSISSDSDEPISMNTARRTRASRHLENLDDEDQESNNLVVPGLRDRTRNHGQIERAAQNATRSQNLTSNATSQRENYNMPGAFPPSFNFSENGSSQVPRASGASIEPSRGNSSIPVASRTSLRGASSRSPTETMFQSHEQRPQLNARAAARAIRKAERQRMKAEQEARRRSRP